MLRRFVVLSLAAFAATYVVPGRASSTTSATRAATVESAVSAMCAKQVVLLGEDGSHGGAGTLALKAALAQRLVTQCGFRGIVFESPFYDMLSAQDAIDAKTSSPAALGDAVGAIWSRYPEFQSFATWLSGQAASGRVRIAGMDPQAGGVGEQYSAETLPGVLSSVLPQPERDTCRAAFAQLNNYTYDDAHPFDAAAFAVLSSCATKVEAALAEPANAKQERIAAMAASYDAFLRGISPGGADEGARDKQMYANLAWIIAHWPKGTKVIVWTASVHAAKAPTDGKADGMPRLGNLVHEAFGDQAYALGFSALRGAYGSPGGRGKPHDLAPAPEASLEAYAFRGRTESDAPQFLPVSTLRALGVIPGRAFIYDAFQPLDWSTVLDGVLVLPEESVARPSR